MRMDQCCFYVVQTFLRGWTVVLEISTCCGSPMSVLRRSTCNIRKNSRPYQFWLVVLDCSNPARVGGIAPSHTAQVNQAQQGVSITWTGRGLVNAWGAPEESTFIMFNHYMPGVQFSRFNNTINQKYHNEKNIPRLLRWLLALKVASWVPETWEPPSDA